MGSRVESGKSVKATATDQVRTGDGLGQNVAKEVVRCDWILDVVFFSFLSYAMRHVGF